MKSIENTNQMKPQTLKMFDNICNSQSSIKIETNNPEFKSQTEEKETPSIKLKDKRFLIVLFVILLFIITFLIILFTVILKKNNKKDGLQNESDNNNYNKDIEDTIENVVELSFKINHVKIYQETQITNTTIIFEEKEYDENNYRRLSKKDIEKDTIITKYLINIYEKNDLNDTLNTSIISAYALVLSSEGKNEKIENAFPDNEEEENEKIYFGGYNIYNEDEHKDLNPINPGDIPLIKFTFFSNGTLKNIFHPENINQTFLHGMKNIISKIIPEVSSSLFQNSKSNLRNIQQEGKIREFDKEKNQIKIEENELDDNKFIGSSILSSSEINIDNEGNIKSVSSKSKSEFKGDENIQIEDISIDENSLLKFDDFKEDNDNIRGGLIKNYEIETESNILLIENNIDENLKNKINNLEKEYNLTFIEYENEENKVLRILGLNKEKITWFKQRKWNGL